MLDQEWGGISDEATGFSGFHFFEGEDADAAGFRDIPDFDAEAQQNPWTPRPEDDDPRLWKSHEKAAHLVSILEFDKRSQEAPALAYLTEFFERLTHHATFGALQDLCSGGFAFHDLKAIIELRVVWSERTHWWKYRYKGEVGSIPRGYAALTWKLAHAICLARPEYPAELMIDDDWLGEWLELPFGAPGYFGFADYVGEKVKQAENEALHESLSFNPDMPEIDELGDSYARPGRIARRLGIPQFFQFYAPPTNWFLAGEGKES